MPFTLSAIAMFFGACGDNGALAARWIAHLRSLGRSAATINLQVCGVLSLLRFLGTRPLRDVTPEELSKFQLDLAASRCSSATVRMYSIAIRRFFAWLEANALLFENPAADMAVPRVPRTLGHVLNGDDIRRLLDVRRPNRPVGIRDRAILEVAYGTGVRISELAGMCVSSLDLESGIVRVRGKGSKDRLVPLGTHAVDRLQRYLTVARPHFLRGRAGEEALWISTNEPRAVSAGGLAQMLKKHGRRARLPFPLTGHVLRRTCATDMLRNGAHLEAIRELLGHKSWRTLTPYLLLTIQDVQTMHKNGKPGR